jgi:hypothetical protein
MPSESQNTKMSTRFTEVAPPDSAPVHSSAVKYGILDCLSVLEDADMFRCCQCGRMQPSGSPLVWVPDRIQLGDDLAIIKEIGRREAYNGHSSGWCLNCARRLGGDTKSRELWKWTIIGAIILIACVFLVASCASPPPRSCAMRSMEQAGAPAGWVCGEREVP